MRLESPNFDRDSKAAGERVVAYGLELVRAVVLDLYSELTKPVLESDAGSPVASGRYAASIRVAINEIDSSVAPLPNPRYRYPAGRGPRALPPRVVRNQPVARVAARLRTVRLGDKVFVSNSLPYARVIELNGHSWQAPGGAFTPTVRKVMTRFRNVNVRVEA